MAITIKENADLRMLTTMKAGGTARYYIECYTDSDVASAIAFAEKQHLGFFIVGKGSNTLFKDGLHNIVVIALRQSEWSVAEEGDKSVLIVASAGYDWDMFVGEVTDKNFFGIENLSLIPGTVGAAPVQNIGAYGVECKDVCEWVDVYSTTLKKVLRLSKEECRFGYRDSIFKHKEGSGYIVLRVAFRMSKTWQPNLAYPDLEKKSAEHALKTALDVRRAVIAIRQAKLPDMKICGTAGSFFKNPIVQPEIAHVLQNAYPDMPAHLTGDGRVKLSAGWLLDHACGLKGYRVGDVGLYERQALVVVNYGSASAQEIISFVQDVTKKFFEKTNIQLEPEVRVV